MTVLRRARAVALLFGAVGAAVLIWFNGLTGERLRELTDWIIVLPVGLWILLPLVHVALFWSSSRRPAPGFVVGHHRGRPAFLVMHSPVFSGPIFLMGVFAASNLASLRGTEDLFEGAAFWGARTFEVLLAMAIVGLGLWNLFRVGPIRLTPDAVVRPQRRSIPWDDLAPDGPSSRSLQGRKLWLLTRQQRWYSYDLFGSLVDRAFLTRAIRYYRENPAARASIGTHEGLRELLTRLNLPAHDADSTGGATAPPGTPAAADDSTQR